MRLTTSHLIPDNCNYKAVVQISVKSMDEISVTIQPGGTPHMKVVGMLVFSLRGVNFGFWSQLGCSGQNAIIFSLEGLV